MRRSAWFLAVSAALLVSGGAAAGAPEEFSHDDWTEVVSRYVDEDGLVDYRALAGDRKVLDRYLDAIDRAGPSSRPDLFPSRDHRLAYYLNAYNALVFEGVLEKGPDIDSVWGLGGTGIGFFGLMRVRLDGRTTTLKSLEDDLIRDGFRDPRIHAALNCASIGCPRLPRRAFEAKDLQSRLDEAMVRFVSEERNVRIDHAGSTVTLNKIFDWFEDDFTSYERRQPGSRGTLIEYINRYRGSLPPIPAAYEIRFDPYDKRLNGR